MEADIELKNILYSILRRNLLRIRNSSENHILSDPVRYKTTIDSEDKILGVIFFDYKKLFRKFCY